MAVLLAGGCAVYQPELLEGHRDMSTGGGAGDVAVAGGGTEAAGSSGAGKNGGGVGAGGNAGAAGIGGDTSPAGGSPEDTSAGAAGVAGAPDGGASACVPESIAQFCKRVGKDCDQVDGTDNCGNAVVGANCGSCQGFKICGGSGKSNVCGALTDPAAGGMATASSVGSIAENGSKAFDLSVNTKWFAGDTNKTGWLAYQFSGATAHVVHSYSVTSANDVPGRDPADWQLQGSNNGSTWLLVDQQTAQVFASRLQTNAYTCANSTAYRWYRLFVTANSGANELQLAELVLYGN
jgi:hypothetical protein